MKLIPLYGLVAAAVTTLSAAPMTTGERQRLVAHLEMTEQWLVSELKAFRTRS